MKSNGKYVVDKFDAKKMEIKLAEGSLKITKNLISEMLRIRNDGINIMVEEGNRNEEMVSSWMMQYGNKKDITPGDIRLRIRKSNSAYMNFKLNFIVLFTSVMGQIKTKGFCDLKILDYIRPDTDMANINWCDYVLRCLQSCKEEWIKGKKNFFCGPLTFLTMAYVDGSKCSSFNVVRKRPPTLVWTSELLREREDEELNSGGFRFGEIEGPFVEQEDPMPDNIEEKSRFEKTLDVGEYIFPRKLEGFFERYVDALMYQGCRKEGSGNANRVADAQAYRQNNKGANFVIVQAMIGEGAISLGDEHANTGMDQEDQDVVTPVPTTREPNLASEISNPIPLRPIPLRVSPTGTAVGRLRRDTDKRPITISEVRKSSFIGRVVDADGLLNAEEKRVTKYLFEVLEDHSVPWKVANGGQKFLFVADLKNSRPLLIDHEKNEKIVRKRVKKKIGACENLTVAAMPKEYSAKILLSECNILKETVVQNASEFGKKPTKVPLMGI
nr:major facilitator superfamily domain, general substrate transporter [Tanacetum cinerariifolium]